MSDGDDVTLWCALNRLIADYWAEVDENGGRRAHEFYEAEGLYAVGHAGSRDATRSRRSTPAAGTRRW